MTAISIPFTPAEAATGTLPDDALVQPYRYLLTEPKRTSYDATDPDNYNKTLRQGEAFEDALVELLQGYGLQAYRPKQIFYADAGGVFDRRRRGFRERTERLDLAMYPKQQRDILIVDPTRPDKRLCLELKARTGEPFRYNSIDVGKTKSWDAKEFKVDALAVIDQKTYEVWVAPGSDGIGSYPDWHRRKNLDKGLCYSIPTSLFMPLEAWVDLVYQGLYQG